MSESIPKVHIFSHVRKKWLLQKQHLSESLIFYLYRFFLRGIKFYIRLYCKCPNLFSILFLILTVKILFQCSKLMSAWPPNLFCQYCTQIGSRSIWILFLPIQTPNHILECWSQTCFLKSDSSIPLVWLLIMFANWKHFLDIEQFVVTLLGLLIDYQLQHHSDTQYQHLSIFGTLEAYCYTIHHCCSKLFGSQVHLGLMNIYCFLLTQTMIPKRLYRIWEFYILLFALRQKHYN